MGYKQDLKRAWSGFSNFAISFTIISVLAGCFTTYGQAWNNGGPVAISWGWPLISIPILIIGFCMSELVSKYPTAGGIYWWAAKLGGPVWGWFTGWFNFVGLVGVVASVDYACATFLNALLGYYEVDFIFNFTDDAGILGETFFLFALILIMGALINIFSTHLLAIVNNISVGWHVLGVAIIVGILDLRARQARRARTSCSPSGSTTRASRRQPARGHVLVLRAAARLPAHAVHDHRLRRLGARVRGDQGRVGVRRARRVAVDLLLGADRLDRAAGDHLRGRRRRTP